MASANTMSLVCLLLAVLSHASGQGYDLPSPSYGAPDQRASASQLSNSYSAPGDVRGEDEVDPIEELAANIPGGGIPGEDFPILSSVPDTGFLCEEQEFPGYFADIADEAGCQVFHICQENFRLDSFICPNGTIFNQQYFVCDWWFNVDCAASEEFFGLNADIGVAPGDELLNDASGINNAYAAPPSNSYGAPEAAAPPSDSYGAPEAAAPPSDSYGAPAAGRSLGGRSQGGIRRSFRG